MLYEIKDLRKEIKNAKNLLEVAELLSTNTYHEAFKDAIAFILEKFSVEEIILLDWKVEQKEGRRARDLNEKIEFAMNKLNESFQKTLSKKILAKMAEEAFFEEMEARRASF